MELSSVNPRVRYALEVGESLASTRTDLGVKHDWIPRPHVVNDCLQLLVRLRSARIEVEDQLGVNGL